MEIHQSYIPSLVYTRTNAQSLYNSWAFEFVREHCPHSMCGTVARTRFVCASVRVFEKRTENQLSRNENRKMSTTTWAAHRWRKIIYKSASHTIFCNIRYSTVECDGNKFELRESGFEFYSRLLTTRHSDTDVRIYSTNINSGNQLIFFLLSNQLLCESRNFNYFAEGRSAWLIFSFSVEFEAQRKIK